MTNENDSEKTIFSRLQELQQQAESQPLTWNPKKGDYLIGTFKSYGRNEENRFTHIVIEDQKKIPHRVSVDAGRTKQLLEAKVTKGDLISIQFLGKERNYYGRNSEVFNWIIDKA